MNDNLRTSWFCRMGLMPHPFNGECLRHAIIAALALLAFGGCGNDETVRVQLDARSQPGLGALQLQITAQVSGAYAEGLRYKWFSVAGGCNPQESDKPSTSFKFADGATRDRVSVEVWRNGRMAGRNSIDVKLDEVEAQLAAQEQLREEIQIEITSVPPYEPKGGPDTRADISGMVRGKVMPGYSVVLYARASDLWYIQPTAFASHVIRPDNTWTSWTHTGSSYAALVVRPGFEPVPRLDVLPKVGGYVAARAIAEGIRK